MESGFRGKRRSKVFARVSTFEGSPEQIDELTRYATERGIRQQAIGLLLRPEGYGLLPL
jgi:hypothetical protein